MFTCGAFVTAVIEFLIIAFVVFLLVKAVNRIKNAALRQEAVPSAPAGPTQEQLLLDIRDVLATGAAPGAAGRPSPPPGGA